VPVRPTGNLIATAGLLLLVASLGLWLRRLHADDPGWSPAALALGSSAVLVIALAALGLIHSFSGAATEPFALVIGLLALVSAIVGLVLSK